VRPAAASRRPPLYAAAREPMRELRELTNETVHLSIPDQHQVDGGSSIARIARRRRSARSGPIGDPQPRFHAEPLPASPCLSAT